MQNNANDYSADWVATSEKIADGIGVKPKWSGMDPGNAGYRAFDWQCMIFDDFSHINGVFALVGCEIKIGGENSPKMETEKEENDYEKLEIEKRLIFQIVLRVWRVIYMNIIPKVKKTRRRMDFLLLSSLWSSGVRSVAEI